MANEDEIRVKKQLRILIKRAHELTIKNKNLFKNSMVSRELESYANRHLGGLEDRAVAAPRTTAKKQSFIKHTAESFNVDDKKKQEVVVDNELSKLSIDQLKVIAKKEYGINTKGINNKADVLELIEQYKIFKEEELKDLQGENKEPAPIIEAKKEEILDDPALTADVDKE